MFFLSIVVVVLLRVFVTVSAVKMTEQIENETEN